MLSTIERFHFRELSVTRLRVTSRDQKAAVNASVGHAVAGGAREDPYVGRSTTEEDLEATVASGGSELQVMVPLNS